MNTELPLTKPGKTTDMLVAAESALFIKEYEKNYSADESKPQDIGMPFFFALA
jgi:hypothetical protein